MAAYEQKEIEFEGKNYKLQAVPNLLWVQARYDASDKNGQVNPVHLYRYLFENVIIEPKKLSADDFDCPNDLDLFMTEVLDFQQNGGKKKGI